MAGPLAWLELRVPPLLVAALAAAAMFGLSDVGPVIAPLESVLRGVGYGLIAAGAVFAAAGVLRFHHHRTTVDPTRPDRASTLVDTGVFRYSRNPMYVGFVAALVGLALVWNAAPTLIGPVLAALWLHRFQILPEERVLRAAFGNDFEAYCRRTPRWLGRVR